MKKLKLFTVGFTKKNAEKFFEILKTSEVKRIIDVRLNNMSQLAGFAKRDDLQYFLKTICNIDYIHKPELAPTKTILDDYKKNKGNWVRPIRPTKKRRSECDTITDHCLLPIDFFHKGKSHFVNAAMTRVYLKDHSPNPPHVEDWILDTRNKPQLLRKLDNQEQAEFFAEYCESDISKLIPNKEQSLGLFLPQSFSFHFAMSESSTDISVRADFKIGGQTFSGIGCTDLRMRYLGRKLLRKAGGVPQTLNLSAFKKRGKQITYLALGLSRLYRDEHWLIVVGVHSIPEISIEIDYARL